MQFFMKSYIFKNLIIIFCYSGTPTLKILNSDTALATAVGDITPGEYKFTLTVADQEKLKSSQDLTIVVKECKLFVMKECVKEYKNFSKFNKSPE